MKIKKGIIKSIEGQQPFTYVTCVRDGVTVTANYIIHECYLIYIGADNFQDSINITCVEKIVIGSPEATRHINDIINNTHALNVYGMMSLEQKQHMDALLSQYYILNDTALIDLIREGM